MFRSKWLRVDPSLWPPRGSLQLKHITKAPLSIDKLKWCSDLRRETLSDLYLNNLFFSLPSERFDLFLADTNKVWTRLPPEGSKNTQEIVNTGVPTTYVWCVRPAQLPAVYIHLLQGFVMISLFSSEKPPRLVCCKQTSPALRSALRGWKEEIDTNKGKLKLPKVAVHRPDCLLRKQQTAVSGQ